MSIYSSSVKHPITTALVYVAIAILGFYSLSRLAIDFLPDLGSNTILVFQPTMAQVPQILRIMLLNHSKIYLQQWAT